VTADVRTLYLCYFGLREPLVQTQVLPYLRELAAGGVGVSLLTFEPRLRRSWTPDEIERERARLAADGIRWHRLAYHKRPSVPATAFDILAGAWKAARIARRDGVQVLHARSHVPVAMALLARAFARCRTIFDVRGLLADEYADAGVWRVGSLPFRAVKRLERVGLRRVDRVVVLTRRMREWLASEGLSDAGKIEVIPCCVDFSRYGEGGEGEKSARFEVVYAGSVTGLYMLEEMARFFLAVRARVPGAFFRVLTASPAGAAAARLRGFGLSDEDFSVGAARADEVPAVLRRARLGVSFRKPTFSQIAASPTKIPEYLAAGLPVVSNAGIGDTDELLERERVGVLVRDFGPEALARAAEEALKLAGEPGVAGRCAAVAREHFDLATVGGPRYRNVYRQLEGRAAAPAAQEGAG
jgi:glycosyltransferase involved in cell wall biosynthesis